MEVDDFKALVREELQEHVNLAQSGQEVNLDELSTEINSLLDKAGFDFHDQFGNVIHSVKISSNQFGDIMVMFNE